MATMSGTDDLVSRPVPIVNAQEGEILGVTKTVSLDKLDKLDINTVN